MTRGGCLCGAVTYAVNGPLRDIVACHCTQCRKTSGHYDAATQCAEGDLAITGAGALRWYRSSATAERGFCGTCGSNLFWRQPGQGTVSIGAGSIDGPTGLRMTSQIHADTKGDYYDLPDIPSARQDAP